MEKKINIAELLKDCPKGMELDCTLLEDLEFDGIVDNKYVPIRCRVKNPNGGYYVYNFTKYGCWFNTTFAKCAIFPKGKTTWEGFTPPCKFKDGDILYIDCNDDENTGKHYKYIFILKKIIEGKIYCYCYISKANIHKCFEICLLTSIKYNPRLATEKEKEKLFNAIKANGYKWNEETKTLEKLIDPKFKVGDRIRNNISTRNEIIKSIEWDRYILACGQYVKFTDQDEYELVPNKFDITTLKTFESKVLVRDINTDKWIGAFYSHCKSNGKTFYTIGSSYYYQCIPYEGNEHLLDTTDDCDEYFKTWE